MNYTPETLTTIDFITPRGDLARLIVEAVPTATGERFDASFDFPQMLGERSLFDTSKDLLALYNSALSFTERQGWMRQP